LLRIPGYERRFRRRRTLICRPTISTAPSKKAREELEGVTYEELTYEGYGTEGAAILVACLTDNKNRTAAEIRSIFTKANGSMAGPGSVAWLFEKKGLIVISKSAANEDQLMEVAVGAGAEDLNQANDSFEIVTSFHDYETVRAAIEKAGIKMESAQLTMLPKNVTPLTSDGARSVIKLIEILEDHDDVQQVYMNGDIPEEILKEMS